MQTLANYRLTESGFRKYYAAMGNIAKAVMKDSVLGDRLENAAGTGDDDLATMAAKYDRVPELKSALAGAGLTSTEYATFAMSYMPAVMAYGLMTQGQENMRLNVLPKGTPKENVDFVRTHQALIQQLDKELKALQPGGSGGGGGAE